MKEKEFAMQNARWNPTICVTLTAAWLAWGAALPSAQAEEGPGLPAQTWAAGTTLFNASTDSARMMHWHRGWLIRTAGTVAQVIDISNPVTPRIVTSVPIQGNGHNHVSAGNVFHRGYGMPEIGNAPWMDLSQLPQLVAYNGPALAPNFDMANYARYTEPWHYPYFVGSLNPGFAVHCKISIGNLLMAWNAEGPIASYDISDPQNPRLLDTLDDPSLFQYTDRQGVFRHHILFQDGAIRGVDFSDPTNLRLSINIPRESTDGARYIMFQDQYGFCGRFSAGMKIDMETGQVVQRMAFPSGARGDDFWWLPLGHVVAMSGDSGWGIFAHQAERDTRAPFVAWHWPPANAVRQHVRSRVGLVVHETLRTETINGTTVQLRPVGGAPVATLVTVTDGGVINLSPHAPLQADTTYEVVVVGGGIKDAAGNGITAFTYRFSTGDSIQGGSSGGSTGGASTGSGSSGGSSTGSSSGSGSGAVAVAAASPLSVGSSVQMTATVQQHGSGLQYQWDLGDGTTRSYAAGAQTITHAYNQPGNFLVTVQVRNAAGAVIAATTRVLVYASHSGEGRQSSPIAVDGTARRVWVVNPDADTVTVLDADSLTQVAELAVGDRPTTVALDGAGQAWVACRDSDDVWVMARSSRQLVARIALDYGARPTGTVVSPDGATVYVAEEGKGRVRRYRADTRAATGTVATGPTPAAMAVTPDGGTLLVTRFISPDTSGVVWTINTSSFSGAPWSSLGNDTQLVDDSLKGRGVPNYLASIAVNPQGTRAWIGHKKDNIMRGQFRDGNALTFETAVRANLSQLTLGQSADDRAARADFDNSADPSAVAVGPLGNHLIVALQGNNRVVVLDAHTRQTLQSVAVGAAPQGVAIDPVTKRIFVQNFLDRSVSVFEASTLFTRGDGTLQLARTVSTVAVEPLTQRVLEGKKLFYHAGDKMSRDGYISCASCHLDGDSDGRVWDFTDRGEGLRNTTSLRGRGGDAHGPVHWTGNFDEIQDFENDIRNHFGGAGLMTFAQFNAGTRRDPMGDPKAGASAELDALAAYVGSLTQYERSSHRNANGSMTAAAQAGQTLFATLNCGTCHAGPHYTDSRLGRRHDVGTLQTGSGRRLGMALDGIDTPTLIGVWNTAPFLHDGSAATLRDVLTARNSNDRHGATSQLSATQLDQLVAFLNELDAPAPAALPAPWASRDIGTPGRPGRAHANLGGFDVAGGGTDIWGSGDAFHFAYRPLAGDGEIVTRIEQPQLTDLWAKSGVMIRETLEPGSRHAMMAITPGNGAAFQRRSTFAGGSEHTGSPWNSRSAWLRLRRSGTTFTGSLSADGTTWTTVATASIPMGQAAFAGLAVCAHNDAALNHVRFESVAVSAAGGTTSGGASSGATGGSTGGATGGGVTSGAATGGGTTGSGTGSGLKAEYFVGVQLEGTPVLTRIDATVDFRWGNGSPDAGVPADNFSVRWSGQLVAPVSGSYVLETQSDDGVRLSLDGQRLIDNWTDHGSALDTASVTLAAGQRYPLVLEYYERTGGSLIQLRWRRPGDAVATAISASQLVPGDAGSSSAGGTTGGVSFGPVSINFQPAGAAVPAGFLPDSGASFGERGNGYSYGWNVSMSAYARERAVQSDQRLDTLNHLQHSTAPVPGQWEIAVPAGSYQVIVAAGDPSYTDQVNMLTLEGTPLTDPDGADFYDEWIVTVSVNDGRLTLAPGQGAVNPKIQYLIVTRVP